MRINSYAEAVMIALAAGDDAATRQMLREKRKEWSREDYEYGRAVVGEVLRTLWPWNGESSE